MKDLYCWVMNIAKLFYIFYVMYRLFYLSFTSDSSKPYALLAQHRWNLNVTSYILLLHVIVGSVITHEIIVKVLFKSKPSMP